MSPSAVAVQPYIAPPMGFHVINPYDPYGGASAWSPAWTSHTQPPAYPVSWSTAESLVPYTTYTAPTTYGPSIQTYASPVTPISNGAPPPYPLTNPMPYLPYNTFPSIPTTPGSAYGPPSPLASTATPAMWSQPPVTAITPPQPLQSSPAQDMFQPLPSSTPVPNSTPTMPEPEPNRGFDPARFLKRNANKLTQEAQQNAVSGAEAFVRGMRLASVPATILAVLAVVSPGTSFIKKLVSAVGVYAACVALGGSFSAMWNLRIRLKKQAINTATGTLDKTLQPVPFSSTLPMQLQQQINAQLKAAQNQFS